MKTRKLTWVLAAALVSIGPSYGQMDEAWSVQYGRLATNFQSLAVDPTGNSHVSDFIDGALRVRKYSTAGGLLWEAVGPQIDVVLSSGLDSGGNLYVLTRNFGFPRRTVWKYDPNGNSLWSENSDDFLDGMAVHPDGGVSVLGIDGANFQIKVARFDADGASDWTSNYAGPHGNDFTQSDRPQILMDADGNTYVTAISSAIENGLVRQNTVVLKYTQGGALAWEYRIAGGTTAPTIAIDGSGNVAVAFSIVISGVGPYTRVVKLRADGQLIWDSTHLHQTMNPVRIHSDNAGNMLIANWRFTGAGDAAVILKYNGATGDEEWVRTHPGFGPNDMVVDSLGNSYVTGQGSDGSFVISTASYAANGDFRWNAQYNNASDGGRAIALDAASNVYVAGWTNVGPPDRNLVVLLKYAQGGPSELPVDIDIKPGSSQNTINLSGNGVIPVAILSSADFDARQVNPLTVTLADAGVRINGNGSPQVQIIDVNGDGLLDIVLHIQAAQLELTPEDTIAVLRGETFGGQLIRGQDMVRIVP